MISVNEELFPINQRFANEYNLNKVLEKYLNPEKNLPTINVVGTNGKGSTATILSQALLTKYQKVGLFISPAFQYHNERIQINNKYISDSDLRKYLAMIEQDIIEFKLTFFEIWTLMAILYFRDHKVDIVVFEAGIGGIKDSTNLMSNQILTLVSSISFDHVEVLGASIEEIIYQKVMITKPNTKVIVSKSNEKYLNIIAKYLSSKKVKIILANNGNGQTYQDDNIGLVLKALEILEIKCDLKKLSIPLGRMTTIKQDPLWIIDGAHNLDGLTQLINSVKIYHKEFLVLFATSKEKDYLKMVELLNQNFENVYYTSFDHLKAWDLNNLDLDKTKIVSDWQKFLLENNSKNILICGSLYFIPLVYEMIAN